MPGEAIVPQKQPKVVEEFEPDKVEPSNAINASEKSE